MQMNELLRFANGIPWNAFICTEIICTLGTNNQFHDDSIDAIKHYWFICATLIKSERRKKRFKWLFPKNTGRRDHTKIPTRIFHTNLACILSHEANNSLIPDVIHSRIPIELSDWKQHTRHPVLIQSMAELKQQRKSSISFREWKQNNTIVA